MCIKMDRKWKVIEVLKSNNPYTHYSSENQQQETNRKEINQTSNHYKTGKVIHGERTGIRRLLHTKLENKTPVSNIKPPQRKYLGGTSVSQTDYKFTHLFLQPYTSSKNRNTEMSKSLLFLITLINARSIVPTKQKQINEIKIYPTGKPPAEKFIGCYIRKLGAKKERHNVYCRQP